MSFSTTTVVTLVELYKSSIYTCNTANVSFHTCETLRTFSWKVSHCNTFTMTPVNMTHATPYQIFGDPFTLYEVFFDTCHAVKTFLCLVSHCTKFSCDTNHSVQMILEHVCQCRKCLLTRDIIATHLTVQNELLHVSKLTPEPLYIFSHVAKWPCVIL